MSKPTPNESKWRPAGAVPIDEQEFQRSTEAVGESEAIARACVVQARDRNYLSNDWKIITIDDATAFAAALRRALQQQGAARDSGLSTLIQLLENGPVLLT